MLVENGPVGNIPCLREIPLLSEPDSSQSSFNMSCSSLPSHLQSIFLSLCLSFLWELLPLILKFQGQNVAKWVQVGIASLSLHFKKPLQNVKRKTNSNLKKIRDVKFCRGPPNGITTTPTAKTPCQNLTLPLCM